MCDTKARMIIKNGSGIATVPVSPDHRDGSWLATDIYEGEFYLDVDTGNFYTRVGAAIIPVLTPTFGDYFDGFVDNVGGSTNSTAGYLTDAPTFVASKKQFMNLPIGTYKVTVRWNWDSNTINQRNMFRIYVDGVAASDVIRIERKDLEDRLTTMDLLYIILAAPGSPNVELRAATSSAANTVVVYSAITEIFKVS